MTISGGTVNVSVEAYIADASNATLTQTGGVFNTSSQYVLVLSGSSTSLDRPAPWLGEHTETVLGELLGYDEERIGALRAAGAL